MGDDRRYVVPRVSALADEQPVAPGRRAFTLVELMVVIAIIGILVALLLPAVQAAREAARRNTCRNHLKQLSLGSLTHHEAHGLFPSGGWNQNWTGDPDQGFGKDQPGGWDYSLLPYVEEGPLHDMGAGVDLALKRTLATERMQSPLPVLHCPSRRAPRIRPAENDWYNADPMNANAKGDYAANGGTYTDERHMENAPPTIADAANWDWAVNNVFTGIMAYRSEIKISQITDGTSNTLFVGEKYLNPDIYENILDSSDNAGDDDGAYVGLNYDNVRWIDEIWVPAQDRPGVSLNSTFGSVHPSGWHTTLCDGSVRLISYKIDLVTLMMLSERNDGMVIDDNNL